MSVGVSVCCERVVKVADVDCVVRRVSCLMCFFVDWLAPVGAHSVSFEESCFCVYTQASIDVGEV